jgi:phosphoribosylformylglycinamidine synthase I
MRVPTAAILTAPGTNRDPDLTFAMQLAGFATEVIDVRQLDGRSNPLASAAAVVIAGGFSYADAIGAGRVFALELDYVLGESLREAVGRGVPVLGICNGFQVLVRLGLLPGGGRHVALGHNESGEFTCRWVRLEAPESRCVWTRGLVDGIECPIAHGEGRFVCDDATWDALAADGQIALRYSSVNPNGSRGDVAGICDDTGLVLGLMPHPENHVVPRQHPHHSRHRDEPLRLGLDLLRNGLLHAVG